ncbi:hypothetical protein Landi51_12053 [Colletotrichum acutatum]
MPGPWTHMPPPPSPSPPPFPLDGIRIGVYLRSNTTRAHLGAAVRSCSRKPCGKVVPRCNPALDCLPLSHHKIKDVVALPPKDGDAPSPAIAHGDGRMWPVVVPYRKRGGKHVSGDVFYGGYRPSHVNDHLQSQQPETSLETNGKVGEQETSRIGALLD